MKKTTRRNALKALAIASSLPHLALPAFAAQTYPSKPIQIIVGFSAGGAGDALARMLAERLQKAFGTSVMVENKTGAGGSIAAAYVANAKPDGYTVLLCSTALVQQRTLMKLPYDPLKDFQPITRMGLSPNVLVVTKDTPADTLEEFIALVKANPGKYNFGSYGIGGTAHILGALLNLQTGTDLIHVPFPGAAPQIQALGGGHLNAGILEMVSGRRHFDRFKLLAVNGTQRVSWLPNVPTFQERGLHSFEPVGWFGLLMPAATPPAIVDTFSSEVQKILETPEMQERINALGVIPLSETPEKYAQVLQQDDAIYAKIIKEANIKLE